jgi:hypothetical protein
MVWPGSARLPAGCWPLIGSAGRYRGWFHHHQRPCGCTTRDRPHEGHMTAHTIGGWLGRQEMVQVAGPSPPAKPSRTSPQPGARQIFTAPLGRHPATANVQIESGRRPSATSARGRNGQTLPVAVLAAASSSPWLRAGRGRRTGLMLSAFRPCQHRPSGQDPGGLGGGHWPITDGHRYAQPLAGGGCAALAWTWRAAVKRVNLDIARSQVQTPCRGEAACVIGRCWAGFRPGRTASTLPLLAARHRHILPRTDRRKAALATSARCRRRRRWPGSCRLG